MEYCSRIGLTKSDINSRMIINSQWNLLEKDTYAKNIYRSAFICSLKCSTNSLAMFET